MLRFSILAFAGAAGTLTRYALGSWIQQLCGSRFPLGTFVVNALGCLIIGFIGTLADERAFFSQELRVALIIGFLGAFTTYSSFAYETGKLFTNGNILFAMGNVFGTLVICFISLFLGALLARLI